MRLLRRSRLCSSLMDWEHERFRTIPGFDEDPLHTWDWEVSSAHLRLADIHDKVSSYSSFSRMLFGREAP